MATQKRGRAQRKGGRELCTIAHVMKLRLVAELAAEKRREGAVSTGGCKMRYCAMHLT